MRNYEHLRDNKGNILLPDPKSSKGKYGTNCPEYLDSDSPDFLSEGHSTFPQGGLVFQLTEPEKPYSRDFAGNLVGGGHIIAEIQDCSGGYHEGGIHKSKVEFSSK